MDGDFELNKLGWYTVQVVQPNDFLNEKLESDQYGIYYSVQFVGDAETYLWQAKSAPEAGQRVYGHLEKAKSGKSVKFRRAKKEDTPQENPGVLIGHAGTLTGKGQTQSTDESIARAVALKAAVESFSTTPGTTKEVLNVADLFLAWLKGNGDKPVKEQAKRPLSQNLSEDDEAIERYQRNAEPMPEPPEDM